MRLLSPDQDGVPKAIRTLIRSGMRVWMITGDKQETAVNIGISCGLVADADDSDAMFFCNASVRRFVRPYLSVCVSLSLLVVSHR
jgi:magnesium-transporting ATPase (P-type)